MPRKHVTITLSAYGKNELSKYRPGLFQLVRSDDPTISGWTTSLYKRLLENREEFIKYWDGPITPRKLKVSQKRLEAVMCNFFYYLKWAKDPDPRRTLFMENIWNGVQWEEILRQDLEFARREREASHSEEK
ncbi:hypothetical protein VKT23_010831 [Stygiomarasmius scandens]|uniref:Uncharacterized protein n=1 Tax=Marasmiellus scandens TaxID=2682957 RepID=A0ABR1JB92_9AGAR